MKKAVVSLIEDDRRRCLSVWNRRYQGWGLPGGKVEDGEDLRGAHDRELLEETGIVAVTAGKVYAAVWAFADGEPRLVNVWRVVAWTGIPRETEPGCPVAWHAKEFLLEVSPFREFYSAMFPALA